ncbi:AGR265Wp [Eremothecium gossypii ATCC 10895]|uniref:AGR265Wp n=1 Tax=Eremothecium gossypii (strain ATCC 10895 / CBS 109.51 / FGSC 9923 / NRRL Y-1056) TaxID=284811 RepID=Q74ZD4_EREGS|nr:AGR265Wp [Eremothecium gossypii ATCC 10895]AAS54755.1 AGR265Wp [Eremothecium gossypii ATCC 10895]AEY99086.1 FAGR265Wp [Eremothecium gossypii FDAG1]
MVADEKLAPVMDRFTEKVKEGEYYEAHQTLRTVANRYVRGKKWPQAIDLITHGIHTLMGVGQSSSVVDLTRYLLEVYEQGNVECTEENVGRLVKILVGLELEDPDLRDVCTGMNNWSVRHGRYTYGDPYLHSVIGKRLLEAGYLVEAERYFVLGNRDSLEEYVNWLWDWYQQLQQPAVVGEFLGRLVFGYLGVGNLKNAYDASGRFLARYIEHEAPKHERVEKGYAELYLFEEHPDLNFLQLLLIACQAGKPEFLTSLKSQYPQQAQKHEQSLVQLGKEFFNVAPKRQVPLLQDLMADFFDGA